MTQQGRHHTHQTVVTDPVALQTLPPGAQAALRWLSQCPASPVVVLTSGDEHDASRWTILAQPTRVVEGLSPPELPPLGHHHAPDRHSTSTPPFSGGWIGLLSYELAHDLEPKALASAQGPSTTTLNATPTPTLARALWLECNSALAIDRDGRTYPIGPNPPELPPLELPSAPRANDDQDGRGFICGTLTSQTGQARYELGVQRVLDAIAAGEAYQANLTHQLQAPFEGSSRALFARLVCAARPWYGAYVEHDDHAIASVSPELFLSVSPGGHVLTRPMKGTRRSAADIPDLEASEKERAELTMIVDLMRNDLGRVCIPGSVRPVGERRIERHAQGGIYQATAEVQGTLAPGTTLDALLRATFPPGSVTGAPKLAAMRLVQGLEPTPRGIYCGAIGLVSHCGHAQFSVAIRTAHLAGQHHAGRFAPGAQLCYGVGAGIVADSQPRQEWLETLDKARVLRQAVNQPDQP